MPVRSIVALCCLLAGAGASLAAQAPLRPEGDEWLKKPVDEATFRNFLSFFAYDQKLPLDPRVTRTEEVEGVRAELLSFQSSPGIRVTAWLDHAPGGISGAPGLVLIHGGIGAGKDTPGYRALAEFFARAGFTTLAIDLQYFGERKGDLLTTFTEAEKHDRLYNQPSTYLAWVTQTVKDAGRGYDLLVERGVDPRRVALVGFSRGAQLAFIAGAADRRFATVVAMMGGHFDANETGHLPAACPANYIGRISPRPLLMVNGTLDADYFPETSVTPLERLARQPKRILWREIPHQTPQEETRIAVVQWLREHLR